MAEAYPDMGKLTLGATNVEPANASPGTDSTEVNFAEALNDEGYQRLELEFLESCEVDKESALHGRKNCKKNPGHKGFIPVEDFNVGHLPEGYREPMWLDFIMVLIGLTVRVVGHYVSYDRPADNYSNSKFRGKSGRWVGSGRLDSVERRFDYPPEEDECCPCQLCKQLPFKDRKKHWGEYAVTTAKHVTFSDDESRHTYVNVDYDKDTDLHSCPKLYGVEVAEHSSLNTADGVEMDKCDIIVVSHDREVCHMLEKRLKRCDELRDKIEDIDRESKKSEHPPVVCVSHPHGSSKHVSVGKLIGEDEDAPLRWRYTTDTCPGSSGAPVCKLGRMLKERFAPLCGHLTQHSGASEDRRINESGSFAGSWG